MGKLANELYSESQIARPTDREVAAYGNPSFGRYVRTAGAALLGLYLAACGGGGGGSVTGPSGGPIPTPSNPPVSGKVTVSGMITGRMSGEPINSCEITYRNKSDGSIAKAVSANGAYELKDMPTGMYEVTIDGCGNLTHDTQNVEVRDGNLPFSVIRWNSARNGVIYDERFDDFFNWVARDRDVGDNRVRKWVNLPTEIYVDQTSFGLLSPTAQDEFMSILREVNNESIPAMYCGEVGPLPINVGPLGGFRSGAMGINFHEGSGSNGGGNVDVNGIVGASLAQFSAQTHNNLGIDRDQRKHNIAHELFHGAFAGHAYGHGYQNGLMDGNNGITILSPQENLAACIVYNNDTKPGNMAPDTNPTY